MSTNKKYNQLVNKLTQIANQRAPGQTQRRKKGNRGGGTARVNLTPGPRSQAMLDSMVLRNHYAMLVDPCYATLCESAYRGAAGYVQRFVKVTNYTTGTNTSFCAIYNPAAVASTQADLANAAAPFSATYAIPSAGSAFLTANSSGHRCIGFCVQIEYTGTELNRSGLLGAATVNAELFNIGTGGLTVADIQPLIPNVTRTMDGTAEVKWSPGVGNEQYVKLGDAPGVLYANDMNSLVIYGTGLPAGNQIRLVETTIYEYLPTINTGLATPAATAGSNPPGAFEKLHNAAHADPTFAHSLRKGFQSGFADRAQSIAVRGGETLANAALAYGVDAVGRMAMGRRTGRRIGY